MRWRRALQEGNEVLRANIAGDRDGERARERVEDGEASCAGNE